MIWFRQPHGLNDSHALWCLSRIPGHQGSQGASTHGWCQTRFVTAHRSGAIDDGGCSRMSLSSVSTRVGRSPRVVVDQRKRRFPTMYNVEMPRCQSHPWMQVGHSDCWCFCCKTGELQMQIKLELRTAFFSRGENAQLHLCYSDSCNLEVRCFPNALNLMKAMAGRWYHMLPRSWNSLQGRQHFKHWHHAMRCTAQEYGFHYKCQKGYTFYELGSCYSTWPFVRPFKPSRFGPNEYYVFWQIHRTWMPRLGLSRLTADGYSGHWNK